MPEIGSARLEGDMSAMQANLTVALEDFRKDAAEMKTAVVEPRPETGLYVGYVPDLPGAHSQGATLEELGDSLREVVEMVLEEGPPAVSSERWPSPPPEP